MRDSMLSGERPRFYLALARTLIPDPSNKCRWQAAIVVGEFIEEDPEAVWEVICEFGVSEDEDMRDAISTVLLEHLLEHHFKIYFPRLKAKIEGGATLLADTLRRCWAFGQAKRQWRWVQALVDRYPRLSRPAD